MTTTARLAGLSARLREMVSADGRSICCNERTTAQMGNDILAAATEIDELLARIAALEAENVRLALLAANGAPVLQQLDTEEQDALVDFIRSLRTPVALNRSENDAG